MACNQEAAQLVGVTFDEDMVHLVLEDLSCHVPHQLCHKIWSNHNINLALPMKGNVDLNDFCSGGILHISDKGQLVSRPYQLLNVCFTFCYS